MLEQARKSGVYSDLQEVTLGDANRFPNKLMNQFDVVTCAGLINNNHLDYQIFEEMGLALHQGGLTIFAARFSYLGEFWYNEILGELVNDKRWTFLGQEDFFKYDQLSSAVGKFGKTPCRVYSYRNNDIETQ